MRLTPAVQHTIKTTAAEVFGAEANISLFGSRTDDTRKGGDIDLLVELPSPQPPVQGATQALELLRAPATTPGRPTYRRAHCATQHPKTSHPRSRTSHEHSFVNSTQIHD